jgi:hypothetical protein
MSCLFWSVLFSCVACMIWRGFSDKRKYFRELAEARERQNRPAAHANTVQTAHD